MQIKKFFEKIFNWELWHFNLLYAPIAPVWLWFCIKSGAIWFFTPSNPKLTFGGLEGEGKKEMYDLLPPSIIPKTIYIEPGVPFNEALLQIRSAGLHYPFVVKPDVGMKGILFRIIDNEAQFERYHKRMSALYIAQEKINLAEEVSVFYYRYPWQKKGVISGFIHKELLQVKGDGRSTLKELIEAHSRAKYRMEEMESLHQHRFHRIIPDGDIFYLSFAGNHNRGAKFTNLQNEITPKMVAAFDELSYGTEFYYGRYDIKTSSINDLKQGRNFIVLEYNGAGAEPNHIYDCGMSLIHAYKIILQHWKALYKISKYNAAHGHPYWTYKKGRNYLIAAKKYFKKLKKFD